MDPWYKVATPRKEVAKVARLGLLHSIYLIIASQAIINNIVCRHEKRAGGDRADAVRVCADAAAYAAAVSAAAANGAVLHSKISKVSISGCIWS